MLDRAAYLHSTVEFVRCLQGQDGFQVQPRRWLVERTHAWLMCYRRLACHNDQRLDVSQAMIYIALGFTHAQDALPVSFQTRHLSNNAVFIHED